MVRIQTFDPQRFLPPQLGHDRARSGPQVGPGQARTRTGRLLMLLTKLLRTRRTSPDSSTDFSRGSSVSNISRISSRARLLPRQKCGLPLPKVTWSFGYLVTSNAYGEANTSGSLLPAANHMTTLSPSRIVLPC